MDGISKPQILWCNLFWISLPQHWQDRVKFLAAKAQEPLSCPWFITYPIPTLTRVDAVLPTQVSSTEDKLECNISKDLLVDIQQLLVIELISSHLAINHRSTLPRSLSLAMMWCDIVSKISPVPLRTRLFQESSIPHSEEKQSIACAMGQWDGEMRDQRCDGEFCCMSECEVLCYCISLYLRRAEGLSLDCMRKLVGTWWDFSFVCVQVGCK